MCWIYPNFLHNIKIKHFIYLHVASFEGIIFSIKVVYDIRCSGPNTYSTYEGGLLLHPQYDAVHIEFITQFLAMGILFSFFFWQASHAQLLN